MTLAIDGGTPVRTAPFPAWPQYDDAEERALRRALSRERWGRVLGPGEVSEFEKELAEFHNAPAALAVTNGTHALQLALEIHGVGVGDEVVVPALTPIPTSNAVAQRGAVAVPADIDADTYCLDPARLDSARTERTKAVIAVHLAGHLADVGAVAEWAGGIGGGIPVIQDAAHAQGARWLDLGLGELGTLATFSFQNSKIMTAGEGGALLFPDETRVEEAFTRHSVGRPPTGSVHTYLHPSSNYRMNEFSAAVLRAQLTRLPAQNALRERRWAELSALLAEIPGVLAQGRDPRCTLHPHYLVLVLLDPREHGGRSRDRVVAALRAEGIPANAAFPPIYRTPAFWAGPTANLPPEEDIAAACPNAELLGAWGLMLPHTVLLGGVREVRDVAEAFAKVLGATGFPGATGSGGSIGSTAAGTRAGQ